MTALAVVIIILIGLAMTIMSSWMAFASWEDQGYALAASAAIMTIVVVVATFLAAISVNP